MTTPQEKPGDPRRSRGAGALLIPALAYLAVAVLITWAFMAASASTSGAATESSARVEGGADSEAEAEEEGQAKHGRSHDRDAVVAAQPDGPVSVPSVGATGFTPQVRLGFTAGDQWEPAIAADGAGHAYVLYPQYGGVPGCAACADPTMILTLSSDGGDTWSAPRVIYPAGAEGGEWDAQIVVDPVDGRTVYASWLQDGKSSIAVAKSTDLGATWTVVRANRTNKGQDKPILAVRGQDVYVVYNHSTQMFAAVSHDGGKTFREVKINDNGKLGWALAGGGTILPDGSASFAWAGYERNGGAKGPVNLFISSTSDGGATWRTDLLDVSGAPPDCAAYRCGWAYLGAQAVLGSDAGGTLYALWNAGPVDSPGAPERIFFASSTDGGGTWSEKLDVSAARPGTPHAFPAIVGGAAGDVRTGWMDARASDAMWNTYVRTSTDGGLTWSDEVDISTPVAGFDYITAAGYRFPFGDYWELEIGGGGRTHAVWGEGFDYQSPGSIWYAHGD
jgi:hypothetical protein